MKPFVPDVQKGVKSVKSRCVQDVPEYDVSSVNAFVVSRVLKKVYVQIVNRK